MSPAARRDVVEFFQDDFGLSERRACSLAGQSRSVQRYRSVAEPVTGLVDRLRELVATGRVGAIADSHYSIMGYQGNDTTTLEQESAPAIARAMKDEQVDLALLAPV